MPQPQGPYRNPYPRPPHIIHRKMRPKQVARKIVKAVEAEGGLASFVAYGRFAKRLMVEASDLLPDHYTAELTHFDPETGGEAARGRKARAEMWLYVRDHEPPPYDVDTFPLTSRPNKRHYPPATGATPPANPYPTAEADQEPPPDSEA